MYAETWQYQSYVEPLHTAAAPDYDPSEMGWVPSLPELPTLLSDASAVVVPTLAYPVLVIDPTDVIPPDFGLPGRATLQVPRVPVRAELFDATRMRRHAEVVEVILNSLLRRGRLYQLDGADEFDVIAPGFSAARDPGLTDDETRGAVAGISWFNRSTGKLFYCRDATEGAAVWTAIN